jgi:hypothetical protein
MILLRKELEPTLRELGFSSLHIDVNKANNIILATECGQAILTFHSLKPKNTVTKVERSYLVRLISDYIYKYSNTVNRIVKAKEELKDLVQPHIKSTSFYSNTPVYKHKNISITLRNSKFSVNSTDSSVEDMNFVLGNILEIMDMLEDVKDYLDKRKELEKIVKENSTCNI